MSKTIASIQYENCDRIEAVRATLPDLPPEQRLWLFRALVMGYCMACGAACLVCHCENDE